MAQKLITLKDIAQKLGVPQSNVRYDRDVYQEFIPSVTVEGQKHPMYDEGAIEVFQLITKLKNEGLSRHQVKEKLAEKYTPYYEDKTNAEQELTDLIGENPMQQGSNSLATTNLAQLMRMYKATIENNREMAESHLQIEEYNTKKLQAQRLHIAELQDTIEQLRERIKELESQSPRDEEQKSDGGLLKRIFG